MDIPKSDAVEKIAALAKDAAGFTVQDVTLTGLGDGLPSSIPVGFDHRSPLDDAVDIGGIVDLKEQAEKWRQFPARRKGTANVTTLEAFVDLTKRHMTADSAIFASTSWPSCSLTAVIDYHDRVNADAGTPVSAAPKPRFCQHCVRYDFPLTEEFKAWATQNAEPMKQGEFAAFIEERIADLSSASPAEQTEYGQLFQTTMATPADMLALSRGLEVNVTGTVKQNVRLSSGEGELVFTEEHVDSSGAKLTVPGLFMIAVPAFLDGEVVRLPARLRYRVGGGYVTWFYQLYRWKELLRERVVADLNTAQTETGLPAYEGSPES